ncbi:hypothetical protein ABOM_008146 [Aspergillus bombycis]|uniref:Uncharacterized protein n=1 Tax=Aspergillus bombycis TaxID=109264 RepID=A0A1F7ZTW9_9EURO|nr:hypothetical protein ABOM_008146 [Aspergillus bombycis]OGM42729.1 hypothetical protein ABOM_008146 [Aspergillus bombycis]
MASLPGSLRTMLVALWFIFALLPGLSDGHSRSIGRRAHLKNSSPPTKALSLCGPNCPSCAFSLSTPPKLSTPKNGAKSRSLSKRVLTKPEDEDFEGDVESFLVSQYMRADWVPLDDQGLSSALFKELGNKNFNMAVRDLWGCASVVVVSEKGIWMSHIWENPSFGREIPPNRWVASEDNVFINTVLKPLAEGNERMPGLAQFTQPNGAFTAEYKPFAYIFYPSTSRNDLYDRAYTARISGISQKLQQLLRLSVPPLIYQYDRSGGDFLSSKGKILFQYEPNERVIQTKDGPLQQAVNRIWLENQPMYVHQRYWPAWPLQRSAGNANAKRDNEPSPTLGTPGQC